MPGLLDFLFGSQPQPTEAVPDWYRPPPSGVGPFGQGTRPGGLLGGLLGGGDNQFQMMGYLSGAMQPGSAAQRIARGLAGASAGAQTDVMNQTRLDALNRQRAEQLALVPYINEQVNAGIMTPREANIALWDPAFRSEIGKFIGGRPGQVQQQRADVSAATAAGNLPAPPAAPGPTSALPPDGTSLPGSGPLPSPGLMKAISTIESGSAAGNYATVGPQTKTGDRAYGRYQIMGANIPAWSQEIFGQPMTVEQFMANPQAQDIIAQTKLAQYEQKYGTEGAGRAWFAGESGMNNPTAKDVNGMTVARYGQRVAQLAGADGAPAGATAFSATAALPPTAQPTMPQPAGPAPAAPAAPAAPPIPGSPEIADIDAKLAQLRAAIAPRGVFMSPGQRADLEKQITDQEARRKQIIEQRGAQELKVTEQVMKDVAAGRTAAENAAKQMDAAKEMRAQLDAPGGIFSGFAADARLGASKAGQYINSFFGGKIDPKITNTEAFRSAVGQQVLSSVKELGYNPTDTDRNFAERLAAGQIALDETSMRRVIDIMDKANKNKINQHNQFIDKAVKGPAGTSQLGIYKVDMPAPYVTPLTAPALLQRGQQMQQERKAFTPSFGDRFAFPGGKPAAPTATVRPAAPTAGPTAPVQVGSIEEARALPVGTPFIDPNGVPRVR